MFHTFLEFILRLRPETKNDCIASSLDIISFPIGESLSAATNVALFAMLQDAIFSPIFPKMFENAGMPIKISKPFRVGTSDPCIGRGNPCCHLQHESSLFGRYHAVCPRLSCARLADKIFRCCHWYWITVSMRLLHLLTNYAISPRHAELKHHFTFICPLTFQRSSRSSLNMHWRTFAPELNVIARSAHSFQSAFLIGLQPEQKNTFQCAIRINSTRTKVDLHSAEIRSWRQASSRMFYGRSYLSLM